MPVMCFVLLFVVFVVLSFGQLGERTQKKEETMLTVFLLLDQVLEVIISNQCINSTRR